MYLEQKLELLEFLMYCGRYSFSEIKVIYCCALDLPKNSAEIAVALNWKMPNISRLLISMLNKGYLIRKLDKDGKSYLYSTNFDKINPKEGAETCYNTMESL